MIIPNQIVKIETIETKITPKFPEIKPEISFPEDNVSIKVINNLVKPTITQSAISIKISEEPVKIEIPEGVKGDKGDKGDPGEPGNSTEITSTAGSILGGNRVVIIDNNLVYYADYATLSHRHKIAGITTHSAIQGAEIIIQTSGEMIEPSWNWESGKPIFIGENGYLTQIVPQSGFQLEIAFPLSPTKIFIEKKIPIIK